MTTDRNSEAALTLGEGEQIAVIEGDPAFQARLVCAAAYPAGTKFYTTPPATIPVAGLEALVERISDSIAHNDESEDWLRGAKATAETIRDELAQLIKESK